MNAAGLEQKHPWARVHRLASPLSFDVLSEVLEEISAARAPARRDSRLTESSQLIGSSSDIQLTCQLIDKVAPSPATVLVTGESGTGKEVIARRIHELSGRAGPFVAVNCGAIPENLLESELFGHEKGAFTGADKARPGRFEQASGGTFFLDEIGDMPSVMQVKLLRVLEERVVERVGGNRSIPVDVRLVAATHRDLPARIDSGDFREDLYYRLSVFPIDVSPLRNRPDDVLPLINEFTRRLRDDGLGSLHFTSQAIDALQGYAWPGNVRELVNLIERLVVTNPNGVVDLPDLPPPIADTPAGDKPEVVDAKLGMRAGELLVDLPADGLDLKLYLASIEKRLIDKALDESNGVVQHAAKKLGVGRTTLVEKIRRIQETKEAG
ncbi:MAG: sigma-54 dependent transcriptional regulator [Pseudomonadota bacterium]